MATVFRPPLYTRIPVADPYGISRRAQDNIEGSPFQTTLARGAVKYFTGFETGDGSELNSLGAGASVQTGTIRTGNYALSAGTSAVSTLVAGLNLATATARFYFYNTGTPGADNNIWRCARSDGTSLYVLRFSTNNKIKIVDGNATSGITTTEGSTVISANTCARIEGAFDVSAGGLAQIYVNGNQDINITHSNGVSNIDQYGVTPSGYYYDDILVMAGTIPPGAGQCIARQGKSGTPTYDQWTKNGAPTAWQVWSETPFNATNNCTNAVSGNAQTMLVAPFSVAQAGHGDQIVSSLD